jgi:WD40-like Beta Propeller Repeat
MSPKLGARRRVTCLASAIAFALVLLCGNALAATETPGETFVASTSASGELAETGVGPHASISADGNLVAFVSHSANLSPEATAWDQAYVKDLDTGAVTLASRGEGADGPPADAGTGAGVEAAILAAGGRYLVFQSAAENLVEGLPAGPVAHVYRRDLQTGETALVDRADGADGEVVPLAARVLAVSADGRLVAFADPAQGLDDPAGGHAAGEETIYVRDLAAGTTTAVAAEGAEEAAFSADGRYLLFTSAAGTLPEATGSYEVYRRDLQTGETLLVSRGNPTEADPDGEPADGEAYEAAFVGSSDCEVAFLGEGTTNLSPGAHPPFGIYLRDFCTAPSVTTLVSLNEEGKPFEQAVSPSTTADGAVAFIAQGAPFEPRLLYLRDPATDQTTLLSRASGPEGEPANTEVADERAGMVAATGCRAIFTTVASNLIDEEEVALPGAETFVRQLAPCRAAPPEDGETVDPGPGPGPGPGDGHGSETSGAAATPSAATSALARGVRVTGLGRRGLWLAFDGAGRARVRVQKQAGRGGWRLVASRFGAVPAAGVVRVDLPRLGTGRYRVRLRLQGDPDNPTLTRRIGGDPDRGRAGDRRR